MVLVVVVAIIWSLLLEQMEQNVALFAVKGRKLAIAEIDGYDIGFQWIIFLWLERPYLNITGEWLVLMMMVMVISARWCHCC